MLPLIAIPNVLLRYNFLQETKKRENSKLINNTKEEINSSIGFRGLNKDDVLIINKENLLYIKSIDNYVEIYSLFNNSIKKTIIRSTLSMIYKQSAGFLIQPHRSYLINPNQSFSLIGNSQKSTIKLIDLDITIPVARTSYKKFKKQMQFAKNS